MWLLDLGNTRLKIAALMPEGLGPASALTHAEADFDDRLERLLERMPRGTTAWLASVAPMAVRLRVEALLEARGVQLVRVASQRECAGVRIAYADPARLGVDRFLGLLAAHARGGDWLVASFGSAITVDLIDAQGLHRGGLIGIAAGHQVAALRERFPALDQGAGDDSRCWAADTADAVAAGARLQALGLVLAAWDEACRELGRTPRLLLGGGDALLFQAALAQRLGIEVDLAEALVLEGLQAYVTAS